jgi:hypothetical protein
VYAPPTKSSRRSVDDHRMKSAWLFSRNVDLGVFLGAAAVSFGALGIGKAAGVLDAETPGWAFVPAIILCDVAHVWATIFRTYLDPAERRARKRLFTIAPLAGFVASIALFALGEATFWRALAYLAIFHFVRQSTDGSRSTAHAPARRRAARSTRSRSTPRRCGRFFIGTRICRDASRGSSRATSSRCRRS